MSVSRRLVAASAALALAALVTVVPGTAAFAHEQLLDSNPAPNAQLDSAPAEASLTFSADVLTIGAVVLVVDGDGTNWAVGDARLDGSTVSVTVDPLIPVGGYEVRWRVVSGDGHPISGIIPFTIGDAPPLVRDATTATPLPAASTDSGTAEEHGTIWRTVLVAGTGALVAGLMFALVTFIGRRRASRDNDHAPH